LQGGVPLIAGFLLCVPRGQVRADSEVGHAGFVACAGAGAGQVMWGARQDATVPAPRMTRCTLLVGKE